MSHLHRSLFPRPAARPPPSSTTALPLAASGSPLTYNFDTDFFLSPSPPPLLPSTLSSWPSSYPFSAQSPSATQLDLATSQDGFGGSLGLDMDLDMHSMGSSAGEFGGLGLSFVFLAPPSLSSLSPSARRLTQSLSLALAENFCNPSPTRLTSPTINSNRNLSPSSPICLAIPKRVSRAIRQGRQARREGQGRDRGREVGLRRSGACLAVR